MLGREEGQERVRLQVAVINGILHSELLKLNLMGDFFSLVFVRFYFINPMFVS